jgi:hypothetical protein
VRPHVSYSELAEFATVCEQRWYLNYVLEHRKKIYSIHFDFGTAIHEALEVYYCRKDPVDLETAVKKFHESFDKLLSESRPQYENPVTDKEVANLHTAGERILRAFKDTPELQDVEVVHNEYPLFENIDRTDGIDIKFKGFIDLVIKGKDGRGKPILWVCDFKTCSWGWDRETREDRWKHYQIFLYKYYLCKKFNIDLKQVRTAFILLKKRPPGDAHPVEFFPVSAGPVSVQRALDTLSENLTSMSDGMKTGEFKKASKCVDKYGKTCPFFKTDLCSGS